MGTKTRIIVGVVLAALVVAFLAGYWPQRQLRVASDAENASLRARVTVLDDHVRLARVHVALLELIDTIVAMNYGQARDLSSRFFDEVRSESDRTSDSAYRDALREIMSQRDAITAAMAKGEPATIEPLRAAEARLRQLLMAGASVSA